jgi:DNA-directed primase/polymerase protein
MYHDGVFALEVTGSRLFFCASTMQIALWCVHDMQEGRYPAFYEVVLPNSPCHVYFDLEYCTTLNVGRTSDDDDACVALLIHLVKTALPLNSVTQCFRLQAHSREKWSEHLILRLSQQHMFGCVADLQAFLNNHIVNKLREDDRFVVLQITVQSFS